MSRSESRYWKRFIGSPHSGHLRLSWVGSNTSEPFSLSPKSKTSSSSAANSWRVSHMPLQAGHISIATPLRLVGASSPSQLGHFMGRTSLLFDPDNSLTTLAKRERRCIQKRLNYGTIV